MLAAAVAWAVVLRVAAAAAEAVLGVPLVLGVAILGVAARDAAVVRLPATQAPATGSPLAAAWADAVGRALQHLACRAASRSGRVPSLPHRRRRRRPPHLHLQPTWPSR